MAKNGKIEYSDEYRFLEDERVYLIKLYANGFAMDNNAFVVLDITELHPVRFQVLNATEEHVDNALLADLRIGGLSLTPNFAEETTAYTVTTSDVTNTITAYPKSGTAEVTIEVGSTKIVNGGRATWTAGANTVKVTVKDGELTKEYTVTVTKE